MLSRNASRRNQRRAGARKMRVEHRREGQQRAEEAERQRGALYRADRADVTSARTATPLRPSHVRASASLRQAETMIAFELSTNAPMRIFPALPWLPSARAPVHGPACAGRSKPDGRGDQTSPAARCRPPSGRGDRLCLRHRRADGPGAGRKAWGNPRR